MPILARNILLPVFMCVEINASRKIDALLKEKKLLFISKRSCNLKGTNITDALKAFFS